VMSFLTLLFRLLDEILNIYERVKKLRKKEEVKDAVRTAVDDKDQRELEKALGSENASKAIDVEGSEIRKSLPGVKELRDEKTGS
jgi:hypothetical protein